MKETLMCLLSAQEIDLEIDKLNKARKDYPSMIEALKKEIVDLEASVVNKEAAITEKKKSRMMIEEEIAAEKDVLSKKEKRLLETQTNKEYTAVQHEIESAREKIDKLETEDLELMTALDTLQPELDELKAVLETKRNENNVGIDNYQKKYDSIETDVEALRKKSETALANVTGRPLSVYTRLRKGKSGIAIAVVDHKKLSCTGCNKQLPPQKVVEVRRNQQLIFCESCGRILMWDDRGGDD